MAKLLEVYKCEVCGNVVEVLHEGAGELVCCGEAMKLYVANTTDAATEKHVPVIKLTSEGAKVTVGSVAHPMKEEHYIEWIQLIDDGTTQRRTLKPGDEPAAIFGGVKSGSISARAYCNLHGLWKS
jgi:superoxide reductase